jgi:molecular chaperone GrpE
MAKQKKFNETSEEQILKNNETEDHEEIETIDSDENEPEMKNDKDYKKLLKESLEYFEGWQRERADFQNYKKRIERDQATLKGFIKSEIIKKYLIINDDMDLALKHRPESKDCKEWCEGIGLIYQKLNLILEGEGVELIPAEGEFDPNIHEALSQVDHPEMESGEIVEVMRKGYKIGEKVIRPALVIVAR